MLTISKISEGLYSVEDSRNLCGDDSRFLGWLDCDGTPEEVGKEARAQFGFDDTHAVEVITK